MKEKVIKISIVSSIFLLLMGLATIFDLSITKAMSEVDLDIVVSIGKFGKLPAFISLVFGFMCIYSGIDYKFRKKWFIYVSKVIVAELMLVSWALTIDHIVDIGLVFSILVGIPFDVVSIVVAEKCKSRLVKLFYFGIMLVAVVIMSIAIIEVLKLLWCRERPYVLIDAEDYSAFTAWFQPMLSTDTRTAEYLLARGIESTEWWGMDEFMSFPSGHAGLVATIFTLCYLPKFVEKTSKYKWLFYTISIVVTVFVCFSRILALMHYMSDVVMAVGITLLSMVAVYHITMCIKKHLFKD